MGQVREPEKVTPIASVFSGDENMFSAVEQKLTPRLGKSIFQSRQLPFVHTGYYTKEMGPDLKRVIYAFDHLQDPVGLAELKVFSNSLEMAWSFEGRRLVNIDVGYVTLAKLVLATTKDHAHRLYLDKGIYAEVTLYFANGEFKPWPWTYPDYATPPYREIFGTIRELHRQKLLARTLH